MDHCQQTGGYILSLADNMFYAFKYVYIALTSVVQLKFGIKLLPILGGPKVFVLCCYINRHMLSDMIQLVDQSYHNHFIFYLQIVRSAVASSCSFTFRLVELVHP